MSVNTGNVLEFKADLEEFSRETEAKFSQVIRWVVLTIWDKVTERTPVDTGRARASWNIATGAPDPRVPRDKKPPSGSKPGTDGRETISKPNKPYQKGKLDGNLPIFVTSNLDYIQYLEAGSSDQAAGGMLRIAIAEVEVEIEQTLNQLRAA